MKFYLLFTDSASALQRSLRSTKVNIQLALASEGPEQILEIKFTNGNYKCMCNQKKYIPIKTTRK